MAKINKITKKRLIISVIVLSIIAITSIFSLIAVFATTKNNVTSDINIDFNADNVSAKVTGKYWYDLGEDETTLMTGGSNGTLTFQNGGEVLGSLKVPEIELTTSNYKVVFEYAITNLSNDSTFVIDLTNSPKLDANGRENANAFKNMTECYYVSPTEVPVNLFDSVELSDTLNVQQAMRQNSTNPEEFNTFYIYIVARISNIGSEAKYRGNFRWKLTHVPSDDVSNPTIRVNLRNTGGSGGLSTIHVVKGTWAETNKPIDMPVLNVFPTRNDYGVDGYYTLSSGGTKYISYFGGQTHTSDLTDGAILYVHWSNFMITRQGHLSGINSSWLSSATVVDVPSYVSSFEPTIFVGNTSITEVNFPRTVTEIPDETFRGCTNLETVTFGEGDDSSFGDYTYYKRSKLIRIGNSAFYGCTDLENIKIPESVTFVGTTCFKNCTSLSQIEIPETATIGVRLFDGCSNISITAPICDKDELGSASTVSLTITGEGNCLPSEYQRVKYIQSTGTQWIDTGIVANQSTNAESKFVLKSYPTEGTSCCILSAGLSSSTSRAYLITTRGQANGYCFRLGYGSQLINSTITAQLNTIYDVKTDITNTTQKLYVDGDLVCSGSSTQSFTSNNLYIFATSGESGTTASNITAAKLYKLKIYDGTTIVRNFIPCYRKADNVIGLYDAVSQTFFTNSGTGTFQKGEFTSYVEDLSFKNHTGLVSLKVENITNISESAFEGCTALRNVELSSSVKRVEDKAFKNCGSLLTIEIPGSTATIGTNVFDGCSNVSITGPIYNKTQLGSTTNGDLTITGKFNALSDRYDRTEYIEATGRQYINTGYSFKSENIRIELAVEFKDFPNDMSLFGSNSSSPERSDLIPYTWYEYGNNIAVFRHWIGTSGDLMDVEYDTEGLNTIVYTVKNNTLTCLINGETYSADFEGSIITGRSLYIFGKNNAGSSAEKGSGYRLYYFRIYDDGELVRDFVPCSDTYSSTDYQPGLYDLVTDVFYTNSGQNEFNLKFASNLKATDYIQSNGSQYINTGYVVSSNKLRIEFAAEFPSTPNDISLFGSNSSNYDLVPYTWQSYGTRVFKHWVGTSDGILSVPYSTGVNTVVYTLQSGTLTCSINGNSYSSSFSGSIITGQNFYIFGKNDAGSSAEKGNGYKLYYFRIYDNDVLVRDFVPCYYRSNSSTVGLYDTVTRTFYSRSGSGSLSKGSTSFERIPDPDERFKACTVLTSLKLDCSGVIPNYAFSDCTNLEEVRIGLSLTKIGEYAFSGCTNLTSVTFAGGAGFSNLVGANHNASSASGNLTYTGGSSLTSIGSYAFKNCTSLTEVEIPESVTTFSDYMFSGCTNLHHLIAPIYSASNSYFSGLTNLHLTINGNGTSIGSSAFYNCSGLTSVTIPSSVTSIGNYAFQYCSGLTSITIPNSVTSIGSQAFYYCDSLTSITIPSSVTSIGSYAFGYCSGLTNVTISYGVTSTGNYTFYNCSGLTSITIPNSVTSIGNYTFRGCTGLTSITIPSSVRSIGQDAFNNCSSLTSITIPSSVTSIGSEAFYGCTGLTSITIPSSVTSIPNYAFNNCTGLTSITIPNSVTSIGQYAFNNCTGLTSITIPSSVTSIGQYAFQNCTGLTSITIPSSVTSIRDYTFYNCTGLTSITIPSSVTSIARYAFSGCTGLTSATFEITSGWSHNGYTANGLNFWSGSFSSETLSDTSYAAKILIGLKGAMTRS